MFRQRCLCELSETDDLKIYDTSQKKQSRPKINHVRLISLVAGYVSLNCLRD